MSKSPATFDLLRLPSGYGVNAGNGHGKFPPVRLEFGPLLKYGQMKRTRFTEVQVIAVLRELQAGAKAGDLWRPGKGIPRLAAKPETRRIANG
jgi:hypothetical protein